MKTEGINWWTKPWAILGAIGFISVLKNVMVLPQDLAFVIDGFRAVSRPVMEFLLGWLFELINIDPPGWALDYFVVGFITAGALYRGSAVYYTSDTYKKFSKESSTSKFFYLCLAPASGIVMWPFYIALIMRDLYVDSEYVLDPGTRQGQETPQFLETFIYAAIILAVAYALAFGGVQIT